MVGAPGWYQGNSGRAAAAHGARAGKAGVWAASQGAVRQSRGIVFYLVSPYSDPDKAYQVRLQIAALPPNGVQHPDSGATFMVRENSVAFLGGIVAHLSPEA